MKFIRLTEYNSGEPIYINADKIETLFTAEGARQTFISTTGSGSDDYCRGTESILDILDMIRERENKE